MKICSTIGWAAAAAIYLSPVPLTQAEGLSQDFDIRTWSKTNGLPDAPVSSILQTRDSYLWIATSAGLLRFDGVEFTEIFLDPAGTNAGPLGITALCEDRQGRLWAGSAHHGLFRLDSGQSVHYGAAEGLLNNEVTSLAMDPSGNLWVGTRRGVYRFDGRTFTALTVSEGLPDEFVSGVHAARSGAVWITTRAGMCSFQNGKISAFEFESASQGRSPEFLDVFEDHRRNLWAFGATYLINLTEGKRLNYFLNAEHASVRIWSLCEGKDGKLWIGTSGPGLSWFDGNKFHQVTLRRGRWPTDVRAICEDNEGNIWLGLAGGELARLHPRNLALLNGGEELPPGEPACLGLDSAGRVTVGMADGGIASESGQRFEKIADRSEALEQSPISAICAGKEGDLWVGTLGSGLYALRAGRIVQFSTANGLAEDFVVAICRDTTEALWVATRGGFLHRVAGSAIQRLACREPAAPGPISAVIPARSGGVWIGSETTGLWRGENSGIRHQPLTGPLAGKSITCLYEDVRGRLWIGTSSGLGCVNGQNSMAWNTQSGLPEDLVLGLVEDQAGDIWLLTRKTVSRVPANSITDALGSRTKLNATLVFTSQVKSVPQPFSGAARAVRSPDGRVWFVTNEGLLVIDTQAWVATQTAPPPVRLEAITANNEPVWSAFGPSLAPETEPVTLTLPPNLRSLEIQFTALNFSAPESVRFRHRLEGFDQDWVDGGQDRRVRYASLRGGSYKFHVTACNADGEWNATGAEMKFIVPTPLWRSPVMLGLYGVSASGAMIGLVRLVSHRRLRRRLARLEHQRAMERERMRIAQDMHDEIGSKLTKISFMTEMAKSELPETETGPAGRRIDAIASTSRELLQALDEIVWAVNPRNDTLEHLAAYLAQYTNEYFHEMPLECNLRFRGDLPHQSMSAEVRHNVFLAFEEALNNVLKHSSASCVRVEFECKAGQFRVTVQDNGRGFNTAAPISEPRLAARRGGNGLVNMRQRLASIGGRCDIQSAPGQGTEVCLSISLGATKSPAR